MPRPEDRGRPPGLEGKGRVRPSTATAIAANSNRYGGAPVIGQTTANPVFSENTAEEITKPSPSAGLFPFFGRALGCFRQTRPRRIDQSGLSARLSPEP
jgi:hypothetical protein